MFIEMILPRLTRIKYHHPRYPSEREPIQPTPYLTYPFRKADLARVAIRARQPDITRKIDYEISEGWWYSREVKVFFPSRPIRHAAVDFALPYGFPVAAPCDGFALASYYSYPILDSHGNPRIRDGKMLNFGLGYFVQIYNQKHKRFVQLGHLSDVGEQIPFSIPVKKDGRWQPRNHIQTPEEIMSEGNQNVIFVKTGDTIGFVGYSGLTYEEDYKEGYDRPYKIDPKLVGTPTIPHVHLDEFQRNYQTGQKDWRRDPFDIYSFKENYPTHRNGKDIGKEPLFLTDLNNLPLFADS